LSYEISEMADMLNIGDDPIFDDRVVKIETHTIRMPTQRLDIAAR